MKKSLLGLSVVLVSGCGVFAASEDAKPADEVPMPMAMTPVDNAKPPPVGGPAVGVHVSASRGTADGSGTEGRPLKSLNAALALAKAQGVRVVACAEDFAEAVVAVDGVSAYGYYDCSVTPWKQVGDRRAIVKSSTSPALLVKNIAMPTRFEGFEFDGPDLGATMATDETGTSIGLEVRGSEGFTLAQSVVKGGAGAAGTDGVDGAQNSLTPASNGLAATTQNYRTCNPAAVDCAAVVVPGGLGGATTCGIGPAGGPGGQGGYGEWYYNQGTPSTSTFDWRGRTFTANAATAQGGNNISPADGSNGGLPGNPGSEGAEGADGANGSWALTKAGFVRGNGTAGTAGQPGQGGGGGGGTGAWYQNGNFAYLTGPLTPMYYSTASGGGGAGGGCGGQPGTPATGGGASIGALVVDSEIAFDASTITSSAGGRAGLGNLGSLGTAGGIGGAGISTTSGLTVNHVTGRGGNGGSGGNGGAAGHGAPGPSIALAFSGARPSTTPTVKLVPGPAGEGRPMLTHAATVNGAASMKTLPAVKGEAAAEYVIKN